MSTFQVFLCLAMAVSGIVGVVLAVISAKPILSVDHTASRLGGHILTVF